MDPQLEIWDHSQDQISLPGSFYQSFKLIHGVLIWASACPIDVQVIYCCIKIPAKFSGLNQLIILLYLMSFISHKFKDRLGDSSAPYSFD